MKQAILSILVVLFANLSFAQSNVPNTKPYKLYFGINYLNPIIDGFYDITSLPLKDNAFVNNLGVQVAYSFRPKQRISIYYNHFQRDYSAKASKINYYDISNIGGWQIKAGYQWLVPLEQYKWINLCFGSNAGFSTNKISYSTSLYEPTLGTYKHLEFNENRTIFSIEGQAGIAFVVWKKMELSLLTNIGYTKQSKINKELVYSYPMYGVSIGLMYVSMQSTVGIRF